MAQKPKMLHEVIAMVLASQPNQMASTSFISRQIARKKLWARPQDGEFPDAFQIRLRVRSKRVTDLADNGTPTPVAAQRAVRTPGSRAPRTPGHSPAPRMLGLQQGVE